MSRFISGRDLRYDTALFPLKRNYKWIFFRTATEMLFYCMILKWNS